MPSRPTSVRGSVGLDAVGEVAAGDPPGGVAHAVERPQPDAHDAQRDRAEHEQDAGDHERLDEQQPLERLVGLGQRHRDDVVPPARSGVATTR